MKTLFSKKTVKAWKQKKHILNKKCCSKPHIIYYVIQERASDEMPTAYKQCMECKKRFKST